MRAVAETEAGALFHRPSALLSKTARRQGLASLK